MKIAACIVTYNRMELLDKCLRCLSNQTEKNFDIFLFDNGSSDGTYEMVRDKWNLDNLFYIKVGVNLGGAGGFNHLIKNAVEHGYDYVWLMDDDTMVESDTLEQLLVAGRILDGQYGFLSSAVLWTDGNACIMNRQKLVNPWYKNLSLLKDGLLPVYMATFVSFFIKSSVINDVGLPIKDFFIWGDDVEYSQRISKKYPCYLVGKSQVHHETANNEGSNIALDSEERIDRYKYAYRNELYIAKQNGLKGIARQIVKILFHCVRVIFSRRPCKLKKLAVILSSSVRGIFFNPSVERVEIE